MKKLLAVALLLTSAQMAMAEQVVINTKNSTMVLEVEKGNNPSMFIMVLR